MDSLKIDPASILQNIVSTMRGIFEQILLDSISTKDTTGTCLYGCLLLAPALEKFGGATVRIRGGGPPMDGGIMDPSGRLQGHYWIEASVGEGTYVIDISSDQFGYPPIVMLSLAQSAKRYIPGDQHAVDGHVRQMQHDPG